jgi:hypothetical protein
MFPLSGGAPVWTRAVAELTGEPDAARMAGRLLTVTGRTVVYSTDAGLIVALDLETGRPAWAFRYPSRGPRGLTAELMPPPRDVCPPVADAGRVFAAPADSDEIIALDAFTGVPLWDRNPVVEVVHLVGVADGRLILTADGVLTGVGAIDIATGRFVPTWGSLRGPRPGGRAIVLGNAVVVPTRTEGLIVLDRDGRPAYPPALFRAIPAGNLAYADGLLVAATGAGLFRIRFDSATPPPPPPPQPPRSPITLLPPLDLGPRLNLLWEAPTPVAERPRGVNAGRLVATRGTTLVVRSLPTGAVVASHDIGFAPTGMADRLIYGQNRLAELRDDHSVTPREWTDATGPLAAPETTEFAATASAAARREWGDGACVVADVGGGRIFVGQPEARWAWTELAPATHRWTGLIVSAGNAAVLDRIDIPAHGRQVAVGTDGATLVVAVVGSVRGLGKR